METIDPIVQTFIDVYESHVNTVEELDAKLGDHRGTGRTVLNKLVKENTQHVSTAQRIAQILTLEEDEVKKVVMAHTVAKEVAALAKKIVDEFIEANSPKVEDVPQLSEDEKATTAEARRAAHGQAQLLRGVLAHQVKMTFPAGTEVTDEMINDRLAEWGVSPVPAALMGAFGKRGKVGRRLPKSIVSINGEELTVMTAGEIAKAIDPTGKKVTAKDIKLAAEKKYENETPAEWEVEVNGNVIVSGRPVPSAADGVDTSDTDEDDDDDE